MSLFSFESLVKKFSFEPLFLLQKNGAYNYEKGGVYEEYEIQETEFQGSVVPLSNSDLKYAENGTYTKHDKKIYTYFELQLQDQVRHQDKIYTISEKRDYKEFDTNLFIYIAVRAGLKNEF